MEKIISRIILCISLLLLSSQKNNLQAQSRESSLKKSSELIDLVFYELLNVSVGDIYVDNQKAYLPTNKGLLIYDIHNIKNPKRIGFFPTKISAVSVRDNLAYLVGHNFKWGYLKIVDVSNPRNIVLLSNTILKGEKTPLLLVSMPVGIEIKDNYAFISARDAGIFIVDVSNPTNPQVTRYTPRRSSNPGRKFPGIPIVLPWGSTWWVDIRDDILYLCDGPNGLQILDISNPQNPAKISEFIHEYQKGTMKLNKVSIYDYNDIQVKNNLGFITIDHGGMIIVDLEDLKNIKLLSNLTPWKINSWSRSEGHMVKMLVNNSIAYITAGKAGVYLIDISNPKIPQQIVNIPVISGAAAAWGIFKSNELIFVSYIQQEPGSKKIFRGGWSIYKLSKGVDH